MPEQSEVEVEPLFATPIIFARIANAAAVNEALEAAILARRAHDAGIVRTNIGGWHSQADLFSWAGEAGNIIARHCIELADAHTIDTAAGPDQRRGWLLDGWANVIEGAGEHAPHIHPGAYWSAVYYVRVDPGEGGKLRFDDPRGAITQMHAPDLRMRIPGGERQMETDAEPGLLLIFPSWLSHSVSPYTGEGMRISVAINLAARILPGR